MGARLRAGFLGCLLLAGVASGGELDQVTLDVASGVFTERLPFDVPFVVTGQAPAGTVRVEVAYELRRGREEAFSPLEPSTPLLSGLDHEGRFRVQVPPLPPNRQVRFHLRFARRLSGTTALRAEIEEALRRGLPRDGSELTAEEDAALRSLLLARYELALSAAAPSLLARGETTREGAPALLDAEASPDALRREVRDLATEVNAAGAMRKGALARWRDVSRTLEGQLASAAAAPEMGALLAALESRPETDPRNGSNPLALSSAARSLLGLEAAGRAAVAAGRGPGVGSLDLDAAQDPADARAVAERYRATAAALQELREWTQALVLPSGSSRLVADDLVRRGEVAASDLEALRVLSALSQGPLHRAERWSEALAATAQDLAHSLESREQAILRMASALEARALGITVRQAVVSEPTSTEAGIYVGLDLGVLYPPELDRASLYVGANLYFRPINKRASLKTHGSLGHRFSLTFGISLNDLKLEEGDPRFEPLLGERSNLLLGAGLRLSRSLRASAGVVLFLKNDPNPLVEDRSLAATFYAALSFDVDVVRAFRSMGH